MAEKITKAPEKSFALFVYNSETEKEEDAKQVVLNTATGEFNEVNSTNNNMIRLRIKDSNMMDKLVIAMKGIYKDPYKLISKEIVTVNDDNSPASGMIVYLPGDSMGAMRIMATLNHALGEFKKNTEAQVRQLKTNYIDATNNTHSINRVITDAMRTRHG